MKKLVYGIAAFGLLGLLLLYMLGIIGGERIAPGNKAVARGKSVLAEQTIAVEKREIEDVVSWPGTIYSRTEASIAPKITARIEEIRVHAGDRVTKGDMVARLDPRDIRARVGEARAALDAARAEAVRAGADAKRIQELYAQEAATRESYDAVIARYKAMQAQVRAARDALANIRVGLAETTLRAPFDGVIVARLKEPGDMGLPGVPVVSIHSDRSLRFEADVPTDCARRLQVGAIVSVRTDRNDQTYGVRIEEITPLIDSQTRTIHIKASLPDDKNLRPGQFGWLDQVCGHHQALLIPISAVRHIGQLEVVSVVEDDVADTRHIRTGKKFGNQLEVLSGLQENEIILK